MASSAIGIKLADSKFFPVLEDGVPARKILDLTTVRDDQTSVQINLFRSDTNTLDGAEYVGTLIIEDIAPRKAGEATIELTLALDGADELSAEAVDLESGTRQVLTVSLETLDKDTLYDLPDFDLAPIGQTMTFGADPDRENVVLSGTIPGNAPEGLYDMTRDEEKKSGVFMPAWLCVLFLIIGVLAFALALLLAARTLLLDKSAGSQAAPAVTEAPAVPAVEPPPAPTPEPEAATPPPVETPATEPAPETVVVDEPAPAPKEPEPSAEAKDVRYKIKWGDTLWDLSETYYRNPWLYPRIAKHNKIRNPNLIIAGTYITIPAK